MVGSYQVERQPNGEIILRSGCNVFKIRLRANPGPNKPKEFLIMFKPAYRYISSLYPISESAYALDVDNVAYTLRLGSGSASVEVAKARGVGV